MSRLCIVYNFAQKYREPIFKAIEKEWDCEWYFGNNTTDIKGLDPNVLKRVHFVDNKRLIGSIEWQSGLGTLVANKKFDKLLMLGEPFVMSTWSNLILRRLFFRKKRIYLWTHGWYGREGFAKKWIKRAFFGLADHVFTYGEYAKEQAKLQGFDGDKITPIHNSLDYNNQKALRQNITDYSTYIDHFQNNDPNIVFVGRLTRIKRLDQLIEAVDILRKENFHVNLTLIGDGSEIELLKRMVAEKQLSDQVWFYGACYDDTQNATLLYNADLCVAPGNVGLTAMHSMAFGTPVLTHNNFPMQMPEFEAIRDGKTGTFFEYGNVRSMAENIKNWISEHTNDRDIVRENCCREIETNWNVDFQMNVLRGIICCK